MRRRSPSTTVVVAGSAAQRFGRAGHAWVFLQYVLGLRRLGHDVIFLDRIDDGMCTDEVGVVRPVVELVRWMVDAMAAGGVQSSLAIRVDDDRTWVGLGEAEVRSRLRDAVVLDVMGFLGDDPLVDAAAARVFVDLDPGFTQLWDALELHRIGRDYDRYVTVGTAIGSDLCVVPTLGIDWRTSLPPVVLDAWPATPATPSRISSIASWRGLTEPVTWHGRSLGVRAHAFRPFASLPNRTGERFELCLDAHAADAADLALLRAGGWHVLDPLAQVGTVDDYRNFINGSAMEVCIAKQLHAELGTGWFSDRSACYLASGRPVVALDTGVVGLPTGEGLVTFDDLAAATDAVGTVTADLARHGKAARTLAEEHLDSDVILADWIEGLGT